MVSYRVTVRALLCNAPEEVVLCYNSGRLPTRIYGSSPSFTDWRRWPALNLFPLSALAATHLFAIWSILVVKRYNYEAPSELWTNRGYNRKSYLRFAIIIIPFDCINQTILIPLTLTLLTKKSIIKPLMLRWRRRCERKENLITRIRLWRDTFSGLIGSALRERLASEWRRESESQQRRRNGRQGKKNPLFLRRGQHKKWTLQIVMCELSLNCNYHIDLIIMSSQTVFLHHQQIQFDLNRSINFMRHTISIGGLQICQIFFCALFVRGTSSFFCLGRGTHVIVWINLATSSGHRTIVTSVAKGNRLMVSWGSNNELNSIFHWIKWASVRQPRAMIIIHRSIESRANLLLRRRGCD